MFIVFCYMEGILLTVKTSFFEFRQVTALHDTLFFTFNLRETAAIYDRIALSAFH
jgi:hypothetical protein